VYSVKYTIKLAMLQGDDSRVEIQELHELIQQKLMIILTPGLFNLVYNHLPS